MITTPSIFVLTTSIQIIYSYTYPRNSYRKHYRILANQAMAAFDAAVMRGVPAELLIYPDENHWVLKPQNGVLWQRTFFEWLDKWVKKAPSK